MMKLYAVRDVKADAFMTPMAIPTEGLALRAFEEACLHPKSDVARYPQDYMLFEIGTYDPNSGLVTPTLPSPRFVASATEVIRKIKEIQAAPEVVEVKP